MGLSLTLWLFNSDVGAYIGCTITRIFLLVKRYLVLLVSYFVEIDNGFCWLLRRTLHIFLALNQAWEGCGEQTFARCYASQVKVWCTKQEASVINIDMKANICSVKYNPGSSFYVAVSFGSFILDTLPEYCHWCCSLFLVSTFIQYGHVVIF